MKNFLMMLPLIISCSSANKVSPEQQLKDALKIELKQGEYELNISNTDRLAETIFNLIEQNGNLTSLMINILAQLSNNELLATLITTENEFNETKNLIELVESRGFFVPGISSNRKEEMIENKEENIKNLLKSFLKNINEMGKIKVIKNSNNEYTISFELKINGTVEDEEMEHSSEKNILTFNNKRIVSIGDDEVVNILANPGQNYLEILEIVDKDTKSRVYTLKENSKFLFKMKVDLNQFSTEEEMDQEIEDLNDQKFINFDKTFLNYNSVNNTYSLNIYMDIPLYYQEHKKALYTDSIIEEVNEALKKDKEFQKNPLYFEINSQGNIKFNGSDWNFLKLNKIN